MPVTTLGDLSGKHSILPTTVTSSGEIMGSAGNSVWSLNAGLWVLVVIVVNIIHPPLLVMLALNAGLLAMNLEGVRRAGTQNTPQIIIILQGFITLQYAAAAAQSIF